MSRSSRQLWLLTAVSMAMMALGLVWAGFETRLFQDHDVWVKPFKFALSMAVFFATLALVMQRLGDSAQNSRVMRVTVAALVAAMWVEMGYISWQAAQGQASHFNQSSLFHGVMYGLMGLGALTLVIGTAVIGWAALRDRAGALSGDLRLGIGAGFILSTVLTLITAGALSGMQGHFVGTPPAGAAEIPFFGWSAAVGDLRPAHFVALHAMQAIPLLAWAVQGRARARVWILAGSAAYGAIAMALFAQAMMGLPLIRL